MKPPERTSSSDSPTPDPAPARHDAAKSAPAPWKRMLRRWARWGARFASLVAIVGLGLNYWGLTITRAQLKQAIETNRQQVAIEAINKTKGRDFVTSYSRLKTLVPLANEGKLPSEPLNIIYGLDSDQRNHHSFLYDLGFFLVSLDYIANLTQGEHADLTIVIANLYSEIKFVAKQHEEGRLVPFGVEPRSLGRILALYSQINEADWHNQKSSPTPKSQ